MPAAYDPGCASCDEETPPPQPDQQATARRITNRAVIFAVYNSGARNASVQRMRAVLLLLALTTDLPNANLPGNSPSLPNSNVPGSLPDDNPVSLPNSDTSEAVIQPGGTGPLFSQEGLPQRNPTAPLTPEEQAAAQAPQK